MKIAWATLSLMILIVFPVNGQTLSDGDIITLKCMGRTDNPNDNKVWLSLDGNGIVRLLPERSSWDTLWLVKAGGEQDVFRFLSLRTGEVYGVNTPELAYRSTRWLFGNPKDAYVRGNEEPTNSLIKWKVRVVPNTDPVQITFENLGQPSTSLKWLNCYVNAGNAGLSDVEKGLTGTKWEVKRWTLEGAIARKGDPGIWLLENNCRRLFPSITVYSDWLAQGGKPAHEVERIVMESLPVCDDVKVVIPPDGTLISQTGGRPGIWRIEGGKKRLFPDFYTFQQMYGGSPVKQVDDFVFNKIPDGANYTAKAPPVVSPQVSPNNGWAGTRVICKGTVPSGWIMSSTDVDSGCPTLGSHLVHNRMTIVRYDNLPVGSILSVCLDTPPSGWVRDSSGRDIGRCQQTNPNVDNVMIIHRVK